MLRYTPTKLTFEFRLDFRRFVFTQDKPLTTEIVFPALTLFNLLTFPLSVLPMVITAVVEAGVAVGRITSFLTAEELQADAVVREAPAVNIGDEALRVTNGTFTWNRAEIGKNALNNINFTANKGELNCVLGKVGAGKSSLYRHFWVICGR